MKINISKLHIHHFLSFDDATIDLTSRGYCLISGINECKKDAARSNGSGKSTIANAISFVLLGETLSGLKSNLANIYFDDGCYVELEFKINNDSYKLIRSKDDSTYGTNLKIYVNGEDKSGKGIRESQAQLDTLLPDLTRELVGSVILLGQGLPDKFTSNSPSGRKEVLEHLSKSDFMIQDLKERVAKRLEILQSSIREIEDKLLVLSTQKKLQNEQLEQSKQALKELSENNHFEDAIKSKKNELESLEAQFTTNDLKLKELAKEKTTLNESLLSETNLKNERLTKINSQYVEYDKELATYKTTLSMKISQLTKEIKDMKEIRDICPTCGQRIPNVIKPDTSAKEAELEHAEEMLKVCENDIKLNDSDYNTAKEKVHSLFNDATESIRNRLNTITLEETSHSNTLISNQISGLKLAINSLEKDKESLTERIDKCKVVVQTLTDVIEHLEKSEKDYNTKKTVISQRLEVVEKMNTYLKRDFRGVLLQNSIDYINAKAKEYASIIFNTDEIEFKLNGNDIDISFCNKDYENLSGGEKQRVDLITQFAIRDMLSTHLNFSSNILFLDEITDNLDADSCDRVINFITNKLTDIESIFIISHHDSELSIPVDSQIIVRKNALGVSEVL